MSDIKRLRAMPPSLITPMSITSDKHLLIMLSYYPLGHLIYSNQSCIVQQVRSYIVVDEHLKNPYTILHRLLL